MRDDPRTITKQYFELSNQGDLSAIKPLFHPEATYSSANTGLYYGIKDIMTMMHNFFSLFDSLQWQIDDLKATTKHITEVAFTCRSTDLQGSQTERVGLERLVVVNGLIRHIEVR